MIPARGTRVRLGARESERWKFERRVEAHSSSDRLYFCAHEQISLRYIEWRWSPIESVAGRGRTEMEVLAAHVVHGRDSRRFGSRVEARAVADANRKTGVLPIFEFSTDLCDQFF
uniref:Uncharacterized protein n=1 Tax=Fagus sylvatica TaxID=28930 RepID=A0A2N9F617_FAGSY